MKSFKQHVNKEDLNKTPAEPIDEATMGDLLIGLGAAGGLLALKKGWDTWGKGSKLAKSLAFTTKQKAKVTTDEKEKRDADIAAADIVIDDPDSSPKAIERAKEKLASAEKKLNKKEKEERRQTKITKAKDEGDQDALDKLQTKAEKDKEKIDKKAAKASDAQTTADAELIDADRDSEGNLTNQPDAQKYKEITKKAPPGWATSPEKSPGKGQVWTKADQDKWDAGAETRKSKKKVRKTRDKEKSQSGQTPMSVMQMTPAQKAKKMKAFRDKKKQQKNELNPTEFQKFALHELISLIEGDRTQLLEELVLEETMTLQESNELQAIMALDDAGIKADINKKGQIVVKKKDLKKAQKALKKSFKKGGEPKLVGETIKPRTAWEVVSRARSRITETVDAEAARELYLFMQNERDLQRQKDSIIKNIARKMKSGKYDHKKAPKLWMNWVDNSAKAYDKLYSSPGAKTFDKDTRWSVAVQLADEYKAEIELGNYI